MSPDCARVMDSLGGPLPAELAAHVASCADCRALTGGLDALASPPPPPAPRLEATRERALAELAARPRPTPWRREALRLVAVYAGLTALGALVFLPVGGVLNASPPGVVVGLAGLVLGVMAGGAVLALAPPRRAAWGLLGACAAGVALAVVLAGSGLAPGSLLAGCVRCIRAHVLLSALPLAVALGMLRHSAFHPARALAAGLSAGAVGLFLLHLHCSNGSAAHLALSHVGPWLLVGALAVGVRSRLGSRAYAP